jgi:hypothetical protein
MTAHQNRTIFPSMANRNPRKRILNPKLSSADNVSQEAADLKRQKLQKGAIAATTSKSIRHLPVSKTQMMMYQVLDNPKI